MPFRLLPTFCSKFMPGSFVHVGIWMGGNFADRGAVGFSGRGVSAVGLSLAAYIEKRKEPVPRRARDWDLE